MRIAAVAVTAAIGLTGCDNTYTPPNFEKYRDAQKTVAILPFDIDINVSSQKNTPSGEELEAIMADQPKILQRALYTQLLAKHEEGGYTVDFQDIGETNERLSRIDPHTIMTPGDICDLLDVDAVVTGRMLLGQPWGTEWLPAILRTNSGEVRVTIHGGDKLMWSHWHSLSRAEMRSAGSVAKALSGEFANEFPYRR